MSFPPESVEEMVDEFRRAHGDEPWFVSVEYTPIPQESLVALWGCTGTLKVRARAPLPSLPDEITAPDGTRCLVHVERAFDLREAIERFEVICDGDPATSEDYRVVFPMILKCIRDADNATCWGVDCVHEAKALDAAYSIDEARWKLREKADQQWEEGRKAGIKTLPHWKAVVKKIREKQSEQESK